MVNVENKNQKPFYLVSIDILKGLAIFPMVIGHCLQWWDISLVLNYADNHIGITLLVAIGLMVFPLFLFIYGFNQTNSFLRKANLNNQPKVRRKAIKRALMLLVFATLAQTIMTVVRSPNEWLKFPNYIFSWHLFHLFAFSTLFLLTMWEITNLISNRVEKQLRNLQQTFLIIVISYTIIILLLFFYFHEYTKTQPVIFPVNLDIQSILEHALLDLGSAGIIPWILFVLIGVIAAIILDLPHSGFKTARKNSFILLVGFLLVLVVGFSSLNIEPFVSPALREPSSYSHVFISTGMVGSLTMLLILTLDLNNNFRLEKVKKLFSPVLVTSKITLTIFIVHPIVFVLNPDIFPSLEVFLILAILYSLSFIPIAYIWQKWNFKYSFEWFIQGKFYKPQSTTEEKITD